jgi:putative transposase
MTQYQVTVDADTLQQLLQRDEGVARVLEQILNQVLEVQVSEQLQATRYERTPERQGYRNGVRPRTLTTRVGTLELRVPQVRDGVFSTELFGRYQRSEQALLLALMEMVVQGVSTRKVQQITEELCGVSFSKSTVSALCQQLDPLVQAWNERELGHTAYPFLIVDALVLKVRQHGRVRNQSLLLAVGINRDGYREVLGLRIGDSESEQSWGELFTWLKDRGLSGVDLVVSDDHRGLVAAIRRQFQGASWQRCQTHFSRNVLAGCPTPLQAELAAQVRLVFEAPDPVSARARCQEILTTYEVRAPRAMATLEAGVDDATAVLTLPEPYRKRLRTTNSLERLNQEIRRRERVIRIFPTRASVVRLIGALLLEQDEAWSTGYRYLRMETYWAWQQTQLEPPAGLSTTGPQAADKHGSVLGWRTTHLQQILDLTGPHPHRPPDRVPKTTAALQQCVRHDRRSGASQKSPP